MRKTNFGKFHVLEHFQISFNSIQLQKSFQSNPIDVPVGLEVKTTIKHIKRSI